MAKVGFAVRSADEGSIIDDHGERAIELLGYGHGEIVTAAGDERDLNATSGGFGDGGAVSVRKLPAAIEERTVNIESDEANRHLAYFTLERARNSPVREGKLMQKGKWKGSEACHPPCFLQVYGDA